MESVFERPKVVSMDHNCFMQDYYRLKDHEYIQFDGSSNIILTDMINVDGSLDYAHTVQFHLREIDSWKDKEYKEDILGILWREEKRYY